MQNVAEQFVASRCDHKLWEGVFCGMWIAESCQRVICGKLDADFFCGMKGKVRNESMRNVTE